MTPGRSLGIASVPNLRDLGGYETSDGATVTRGLVHRSDQLNGISPNDMSLMADPDLKVDYDLRTAEERDIRPDELPLGVEYVWLDVLADADQAGPAILGVKTEYLDAAFDEMEARYGTIEAYFSEGLGIDAAQQETLRDLYLGRD